MERVIFQFPHTGKTEWINRICPNYQLLHNFVVSAFQALKKEGLILISTVDNHFYNNMFKLDELANSLKIPTPVKYKFDPKDFKEYQHINTNDNDSALATYDQFATWKFAL